jgi:hypothetical protein
MIGGAVHRDYDIQSGLFTREEFPVRDYNSQTI